MGKTGKENTLGGRIKTLREERGWTQDELAERMCIPKSTVSAYENNRVDIKGSVLVELSGILNTSPDYLLGLKKTDRFIEEATILFTKIDDQILKDALLVQLRVLAGR